MSTPQLHFAELINSVRFALEEADMNIRQHSRETLFELSELELQINFTVEQSTTSKGGLNLQIVTLGADIASRASEIQSVKIKYSVKAEALASGVPGSRAHSSSMSAIELDVEPL
jgi:hypothetical protein